MMRKQGSKHMMKSMPAKSAPKPVAKKKGKKKTQKSYYKGKGK